MKIHISIRNSNFHCQNNVKVTTAIYCFILLICSKIYLSFHFGIRPNIKDFMLYLRNSWKSCLCARKKNRLKVSSLFTDSRLGVQHLLPDSLYGI